MFKNRNPEITMYKDAKDRFYKVGDLVYNPAFGDVWEVKAYNNIEHDSNCKYALVLWGDWNNYYMDIDEPDGFIILASRYEKGYFKLKAKCRKITRKNKMKIDK